MKRLLVIAIAALIPAAAADTPPGELPVDPYVQSDENAGGDPRASTRVFDAFGGKEGIDRVVDHTVTMATQDPRIEGIFAASDLVRLRRTLSEQICFLLGGPCTYTGRDMESVHRDHGITTREFNALVDIMQDAMDEEGVPYWAQNKLLAQLAPMHGDVVTR